MQLMAATMSSNVGTAQQQEPWTLHDDKNGTHAPAADEGREAFSDGPANEESSVTTGQDQPREGRSEAPPKGSSTKSGAVYRERHVKVI